MHIKFGKHCLTPNPALATAYLKIVLLGHIPGQVARRPEVPDRLNTLNSCVSPSLALRDTILHGRRRRGTFILFREKNKHQCKLNLKPQAMTCGHSAD